MIQSCLGSIKSRNEYSIERKAIDVSGGLGSLYDASTDNFIDQTSIQAFETKLLHQSSICRILPNYQSNKIINYLKEMDFNDALRQSILLQMIRPSGVSRLINYNQSINQNTRFLYYSYSSRKEKLSITAGRTAQIVESPLGGTCATHMITEILWGIEILCVIQIPRNQSVNKVDQLLHYICNLLQYDQMHVVLDRKKIRLINQLNTTLFGSETCINRQNTTMFTMLANIQHWLTDTNYHHPLKYTMQSLRWLYNNNQFPILNYLSDCNDHDIVQIELILIYLKNQINGFKRIFQKLPTNLSSSKLDRKLKDAREHYRYLLEIRNDGRERLRRALVDIRRRRLSPRKISIIISDQCYSYLRKTEIKAFHIEIRKLLDKTKLINKLNNSRIEYINVMDIAARGNQPLTIENIDIKLKYAFSNGNHRVILWYSTDRLKCTKANRYKQIYQQLILKRQQTTKSIRLVYADFSYCKQKLEDFTIVKLPLQKRSESAHDHIEESVLRVRRPSSLVTEINVLLFGETGVGKSTFINAFANYLKFNTLQQAQHGEPVVLIPVSFVITVGDQFEQFMVKFGDVDLNENYEHQSVTQQCKSYLFDLNDRLRLRLIDTPGIGDKRGIIQDREHIDHILTYINNLSHLNAICLLFQPNTSRLNEHFRLCFNQLLTYLTPAAYDNIIFCFTNARSTFFAPGNTGQLLQQMLNDEHLNDIRFQQENTFCFDNEAFRYLIARKCNINFDDYQTRECIYSWNTSFTESIRLLNFIQTRQPYDLEQQSLVRNAALEILMLARPLMETLRLIIYNWKLSENELIVHRIELNSMPVKIEMCTHCAQTNIAEIGPFWLTQYQPVCLTIHTVQHCHCPSDRKHFLIESIIQHEYVAGPAGLITERWEKAFYNFLFKCDRLLHFLQQQQQRSFIQNDPFQPILERFLEEEEQISHIRNIDSNENKEIHKILYSLRQMRQQNSQKLSDLNERLSLSQVYKIIDQLSSIPTVRKQINSIKESRQLKMKAEYHQI